MKKDDYIAGSHHYWTHFWCGLIFGAGLGAWVSGHIFDTRWEFIVLTLAIALSTALCCGRCGDGAWEWLMETFRWLSW